MYRVRSRRRVRQITKTYLPDLVYERYALFQELGSAARANETKWVLEVNALLSIESTGERRATVSRQIAKYAEARTLRSADLIVAVTDELASALNTIHGIPLAKILVLPNGVDGRRFSANHLALSTTDQSGDANKTLHLGFIGAMYSWQKLPDLIRAVAATKDYVSKVTIVGSGPAQAEVQQAASDNGLRATIEFTGRVQPDAVPALLQSFDVCFAGHASEDGSYFSPLKLWEYLAAGKTVIASRHAKTAELEEDGFSVVTFADQHQLQTAISTISRNFLKYQSLAASSRELVLTHHSWTARVSELLNDPRLSRE